MKAPHRLHVSMSGELMDSLKKESALSGAPIAEVVRRAVDEYLARCERQRAMLAEVERAEAAALLRGKPLRKGFFSELFAGVDLANNKPPTE